MISTPDKLKQDLPDTSKAEVPAALLPYQQAWISDESPLKVDEKSRRVGITWAEAADDVLTASKTHAAGGQNVYYIGYNMDMAIEFIEACAMWARVFSAAAEAIEEGEEVFTENKEERHIKTYTIRFASGKRIVALSSRPANLRGKQGIVVIDEAAFHDRLDELLKAALALLIWGGKVRVISTHNGETNPFNELVKDIKSGRRRGSVHHTDFHEAIEQGLYKRVCLRLRKEWSAESELEWIESVYAFYGDAATEELDVIPSQGSGAWLTTALIESRMVDTPVLRYSAADGFEVLPDQVREAAIQSWLDAEVKPLLDALDPNLDSGFGEDFGRTGDLSIFAPFQITQQLKRRFPFVIELRNMPFRQQEQILFFVVDRLPRFIKGALDGRGNGAALAEYAMQRYGATRIEIVMATETWYRQEMTPLKEAFEDDTIEVPRDRDILNDLRAIKVVRGVPRVPDQKTQGSDGGKRHGDAAIALAIAHFASRNPSAPIEFTAVPTHTRGFDNVRSDRGGDINVPEQQAW